MIRLDQIKSILFADDSTVYCSSKSLAQLTDTAEKVKNTHAYYQLNKCDVNKNTSAIHICNHIYADLLSMCKLYIGKQYGIQHIYNTVKLTAQKYVRLIFDYSSYVRTLHPDNK